jgi:hypothetical protein
MEDVGKCLAIWSILRSFGIYEWPFGIFYGCLVHFPRFEMLHLEKSGNPASKLATQTAAEPNYPTLIF